MPASSPPIEVLWHATGTLRDVWEALQVELQGKYPVSRLQQFREYLESTSALRVALTCFLTPLPSFALVLLMDIIPLQDPHEGINQNYVFWLRNVLITVFITIAVLHQFRTCLLHLPISNLAMAIITMCATTAGVGTQYAVAHVIGFPVPFSLVFATFLWTPTVVTGCSTLWGKKVMRDKQLLNELLNYLVVFMCQVSLTLIYPAYIYVFNSLTGWPKNAFVLLLPLMKVGLRNWISRFLHDVDEAKAEVVIFNIDVFNALYMSCSLSSASSAATTGMVMVVDAVQAWISIRDISHFKNQLDRIMAKLPRRSSLASSDYDALEVCRKLLQDPQVASSPKLQTSRVDKLATSIERGRERRTLYLQSMQRVRGAVAGHGFSPIKHLFQTKSGYLSSISQSVKRGQEGATVVPVASPKITAPTSKLVERHDGDTRDMVSNQHFGITPKPPSHLTSLSLDDRVQFVESATRMLFLTEFVVLVEYTEVMMPVIFTLYLVSMTRVPNRQFYPSLAALSGTELEEITSSVVAYSVLELLSFFVFALLVYRKTKFSPLRQAAFVLDKQAAEVQCKLILWTCYVFHSMLLHFGVFTIRTSISELPYTIGLTFGV